MSKKLLIVIAILLIAGNALALRALRPFTLVNPITEDQVSQLNKYLEELWNMQNGRFEFDVVSTTKSNANNGEMWIETDVTAEIKYRANDTTFTVPQPTFGEIYVQESTVTTTLNSAAKVQITTFDTNGSNKLTTPDHTSDHITLLRSGKYLVTISVAVHNNASQSHELQIELFKNDGATGFENVHAHRGLKGGSGDKGSISMNGIISGTVGDTIELWANTDAEANRSVTFSDVTLSLTRVGE